MSDDDNQGPFNIGFRFPFYGEEYEQFRICSNGFITFGDEFRGWDHREQRFPSQEQGVVPFNVIAPLWMDLNPAGQTLIYYWTNDNADMLVVEWREVPTYAWDWYDGRGPKTFEVVLHANGIIVFQYLDGNDPMNQGVVGIQNGDGSIGLTVAANEAYLEAEMAVRIMAASGTVTGSVVDAADDSPIVGAVVTLSDGTSAQTNEDGLYVIPDVPVGVYTATATAPGYNPATSEEFEVVEDEETAVDFSLTHPEIRVEPNRLAAHLQPGEETQRFFSIINEGNGPLEYACDFELAGRRDDIGDTVTYWSASRLTNDNRLRGVVVLGERIYITGSNNSDEPNYVYVISLEGEYQGRFEQPFDNPSRIGMYGLTTDGEYLYAADGDTIVQFTPDGLAVGYIQAPLASVQNLAYDAAADHFWCSGVTGDLYEIDRGGRVVRRMGNNLRRYGMAWRADDPEGFNLYVVHQIQGVTPPMLKKIRPADGTVMDVAQFGNDATVSFNDFALTIAYNPVLWAGVALTEQQGEDFIWVFELELNTSWLEVDPMVGVVESGSAQEVGVVFNAGDFAPGVYALDLVIRHNAAGDPVRVNLEMTVASENLDFYDFYVTEQQHTFTVTQFTFGDEPAAEADEIGVFTADGLCVGGARWSGGTTDVPAYADDPATDVQDGFSAGEPFTFRAWRRGMERDVAATFTAAAGDTTFQPGGATTGTLRGEPLVVRPNRARDLPAEFALDPAQPNPFNLRTRIGFAVPHPAEVNLSLIDLQGRVVRRLASGAHPAGRHSVELDARGLSSGTYLVRLESSGRVMMRKVLLLK